jgi:hypothetical protein
LVPFFHTVPSEDLQLLLVWACAAMGRAIAADANRMATVLSFFMGLLWKFDPGIRVERSAGQFLINFDGPTGISEERAHDLFNRRNSAIAEFAPKERNH